MIHAFRSEEIKRTKSKYSTKSELQTPMRLTLRSTHVHMYLLKTEKKMIDIRTHAYTLAHRFPSCRTRCV